MCDFVPHNESFPVAESDAMQKCLPLFEKVASSGVPVSICAEKGAGKKFWARYIYKKSDFALKPFFSLSCSTLDAEELKEVLKTDAMVYLSDFSAISYECQLVLLDALDLEVGKRPFRLIVSSKEKLDNFVGKSLDAKLFYQLSVLPISIPPLRNRRKDLLLLAEFFLNKFSLLYGKKFSGFSDECLLFFEKSAWQGNVRELSKKIEVACKNCEKSQLGLDDFPLFCKIDFTDDFSLKDAVWEFKKNYILDKLNFFRWNKTATAKALKIERTYLSKLVSSFGIE